MSHKVLSENGREPPAVNAAPPKPPAIKPLPEDAMIIIPMRNTVLFPGVITPITVGRIQSVTAAQEAVRSEKKVGSSRVDLQACKLEYSIVSPK